MPVVEREGRESTVAIRVGQRVVPHLSTEDAVKKVCTWFDQFPSPAPHPTPPPAHTQEGTRTTPLAKRAT